MGDDIDDRDEDMVTLADEQIDEAADTRRERQRVAFKILLLEWDIEACRLSHPVPS